MMNWNLIYRAVDLVVFIEECENIYESDETIETRVLNWYKNTNITTPETLAALALTSDFNPLLSDSDIAAARECYFPTEPQYLNNFHIHEIEESINDELWRMEVAQ